MRNKHLVWLAAAACLSLHAATPVGQFEDHSDVGTVLHAGTAKYDAAKHSYMIAGSGENMWFANDDFQYVWKKTSGDFTLTADISFLGKGVEGHRKGVLMARQSLDADSAYADVALHGDGLTSLQARDEKGATTREVQSAVSAPARLRIVKRGDYFYMWLAGAGEELHMAGGGLRVPLRSGFYVGLGVCSHNKDAVEQAVFSNVDLRPNAGTEGAALYSTLETVAVSSTDRRVTYVADGRLTAPTWTSDGAALVFERKGHFERVPVGGGNPEVMEGDAPRQPLSAGEYTYFHSDRGGTFQIWRKRSDGGEPEQVTSGDLSNCFPHTSPDGKQMIFLSFEKSGAIPVDRDLMLRVMSLADGNIKVLAKLVGGKGTIDAPCWSPDSKRVAFVSYQLLQ